MQNFSRGCKQQYQEMIKQRPRQGCQIAREEAKGMAAGGEAPRAADPVDIGLHAGGKVIIDDVWQVPDVQAPAGNIRGDQHLCCAILECLQSSLQHASAAD